jgi:hypothetical protein
VEFLSGETVSAAPPQQIETLRAELFKQRRKSETISDFRPACGEWRLRNDC